MILYYIWCGFFFVAVVELLGFFLFGQVWFCFSSYFNVLHLLSMLYLFSNWDIWETFIALKGLHHFNWWLKIVGKQVFSEICFPPKLLSQLICFLKTLMLFFIVLNFFFLGYLIHKWLYLWCFLPCSAAF